MTRLILPADYPYKTDPYQHQHDAFLRSRDERVFALLMDMGTGKSKVTIDTAAWLWMNGHIDFFFVNAPNEVHRNWILREIPAHLPDIVPRRTCTWSSNMKKGDWEDYWSLWDREFIGLRILAVNIEAWGVSQMYWDARSNDPKKPKFRQVLDSILNTFKILLAVDESSKIKTPGAKRTRRLITAGKHVAYKRILTGTVGLPLETFSQFKFLDETILGCGGNFYTFKHRYAEWETERNWKTQRNYEVLKGYKHLDELHDKIGAVSFRALKKDCLDLPEKNYIRRSVTLAPDQKRQYEKLKREAKMEIKNAAGETEEHIINLVLTRYLRLQQILGGFKPTDNPDEGAVSMFDSPKKNPRIAALFGVIEELEGKKVVIWARFRAEIEAIFSALSAEFGEDSVVTLYGGTEKDARAENIDAFQEGDARFFVSNQRSGGYGLTLTAASYEIYYSNDFSLEARLQSEDRIHRIGQTEPCTYIDLEARDTIDSKIVLALVLKKTLADLVTGDPPENWLEPLPEEQYDSLINQAIDDALGIAFGPEEA